MVLTEDEANAALRRIAIDAFNALRLFYAFEAPEGFTLDLTGGRKLIVGKDGLILMRDKEGKLKVVPVEAAVILTLSAIAVNAAHNMFTQGQVEGGGDPNG